MNSIVLGAEVAFKPTGEFASNVGTNAEQASQFLYVHTVDLLDFTRRRRVDDCVSLSHPT